jgi:site-specific DNA recombinase
MRNPVRLKIVEADPAIRYFAYYRKSTESDERQVQSLPDQRAWAATFVQERGLRVVEHFQEAKSARKTGRAVFDEMLSRVEAGEANAIIAWAPDRLARNAADGARIIELLDRGKLKHLEFATYAYQNTSSGKFMLGFLFAQSKYYTDSLSEVVMRGMRSKANRGIYPGWAKYGYYNHAKTKECLPDPVLVPLIRKAYELYATNIYSLQGLSDKLFTLGLTNRTGGKLCKRQVVDILTDPFYYGAFVWSGELWDGIHAPTVSKELWDKVQQVYKARSKSQSKWKHEQPFCGLIRCAECGGAITSEKHTKRQLNGNVHTWVYYRCTKKSGRTKCTQPFLREEALAEQCRERLSTIALPDDWALPMLEQLNKWELEEAARLGLGSAELHLEAEEIAAKQRRLTDLHVDGEIDRAEYLARKRELVNLKIALEARKRAIARDGQMYWLEPLRKSVKSVWERNLASAGGDLLKLRDLVAEVGSNLTLNSRKVLWDWNSPYALLAERGTRTDWWARGDSNPHGCPLAPKASASAIPPLARDEGIIAGSVWPATVARPAYSLIAAGASPP